MTLHPTTKLPNGGSTLDEKVVIRRLSLVSIIGNAALSGFKLLSGIIGHSGAMLSDAVHSFSDVLTTVVAYFGVKISKKPPTARTPSGMSASSACPPCFWGCCWA